MVFEKKIDKSFTAGDADFFEGKKVLVVGLGRSGLAATRLLSLVNAEVTVSDYKNREELKRMIDSLPEGIKIETDEYPLSLLNDAEMLVVSPGVQMNNILINHARERGIEVIGEIELAYRIVKPYSVPWIAITGTNGKSTTTKLVDLMLKKAGYTVLTGGNIGNAITEEVYTSIKAETLKRVDYIVVELSSFQLESISEFNPSVASILNITPDHLNRYKEMDEYILAKSKIFQNQGYRDYLILNRDDPVVSCLGTKARSHVYFFSRDDIGEGAYLRNGWLSVGINGKDERIIKIDDIRIKGIHNQENSLAALLTVYLCNAQTKAIRETLIEFSGLEHRMEYVDEIGGVSFYNDSKGTNIGSVIRSLRSFEKNVILILGGRDKGSDFTSLYKYITGRVKGIIAMGEARNKIISQIGKAATIYTAEDMAQAVSKAYTMAESGDSVLLSPGCASFDQFENFEQRGMVFKELVRKLKDHDNGKK